MWKKDNIKNSNRQRQNVVFLIYNYAVIVTVSFER